MVKAATKQAIKEVRKRDGSIVAFDETKIVDAIWSAMKKVEKGSRNEAEVIASRVRDEVDKVARRYKNFIPDIEGIQDAVEKELILADLVEVAKEYILYRKARQEERAHLRPVPKEVERLAKESKQYFRNDLAEFIYYRSYSKWIDAEKRRETWIETVDRYIDFMKENLGDKLSRKDENLVRTYILNQWSMPSMRLMWSAGNAARKTNVCGYNCSFIAPSKPQDFGEIMYISMCGTGVGFSVESDKVQRLPQIKKQTGEKVQIVVKDSKEGWADAFVSALKYWFEGKDVDVDYSQLRPEGARLKTMGGKSSGPAPLMKLMAFTRGLMLSRQGRRLSNIDVHDIVCKIGEIVVSGGVRRSALISLSDLDDEDMRNAKAGQFWNTAPQRMMANNSAIYNEKPSNTDFLEEWIALMKSGSGERGIFNRAGLEKQLPARRWETFKKHVDDSGTNPCGEIILRSKQFCNLSEVVARPDDTEKTLLEKIRVATIIGTYQSSLTKFGYLSKEWKKNCEEEALLGVSITGQWDCPAVHDEKLLQKLRDEAIKVNKQYAQKFGVNPSTCITCVKPSGTVSQLVDASSGMHPRHAPYYIRRIRISATDSLFKMLASQGVPYHPEVGQSKENANTFVLEFPVKAPEGAILKDDQSAITQLEHWLKVKNNYTEHNPSVTVSVGDDEWIEVGNWVYSHWDMVGGLSFLPRSDHVYQLAPYEEISKKKYEELMKKMPKFDFSRIVAFEGSDETEGAKELACVSGSCEV
ncbi:MAG: ATP cone domain-containing protein [Patescibacteria group bacterium]